MANPTHTLGITFGVDGLTLAAVALASAASCFMEAAATVAGAREEVAMDRAAAFPVVCQRQNGLNR